MNIVENITRAFKYKGYRSYFFWQFISFIGTWMQNTAQSWLIYKLTGSALFLGAVSFASSMPSLIFAPLSGVVSDRFQRKHILIATQTMCLIQGIILIGLFFTGIINKWHILILALFLGIANSFDVTARQTFIPLLVSKDDLLNAIALNSSMFNAARIVGPAIAGILIATYGEGPCFILNVISYIPIILFLIFVSAKEQLIKKIASPFSQMKEGILFAWQTTPIKYLLLMVGTVSFWGMSFSSLLPIFSDQILHRGAKGLGMLLGSSGIGAVIGGLFLASRQNVIGIKKNIAFASITFSICLFIFAHSHSFLLSTIVLSIIGFCFMIINAGSNTAMQAISPDHLRGRIVGLYSTMFMGMFPIGSLVLGYLANKLTVPYAVSIGAMVCLCMGIYFSFQVNNLTKETKDLIELRSNITVTLES